MLFRTFVVIRLGLDCECIVLGLTRSLRKWLLGQLDSVQLAVVFRGWDKGIAVAGRSSVDHLIIPTNLVAKRYGVVDVLRHHFSSIISSNSIICEINISWQGCSQQRLDCSVVAVVGGG